MSMKLSGIGDLIPFLRYLRGISAAPWYRLSSSQPDAVMVDIAVPGARVEVEFFADRVEYSVFTGTEDVRDDVDQLFALIEGRGN